MARPKDPLPEGFEENVEAKEARCLLCRELDPTSKMGSWIKRTSVKQHIRSEAHATAVSHKAQCDEQKRLDEERLRTLRTGPTASLGSRIFDIVQSHRAGMFSQPARQNDDTAMEDPPEPEPHLSFDPFEPMDSANIQPVQHDADAKRRNLEDQFLQLLHQAEHNDEYGFENQDDEDFAEEFRQLGIDEVQDPEEIMNFFNNIPIDSDYSPYPNKVMMLLDILDNLPRLRMSSNLLRMILWVMRECGIPNVPSYDAFRKMQNNLRDLCGSKPTPCESSLGNVFYVNNIQESVARDFANPEIAKNLNFYPEETKGPISEVWQAERWKEFRPNELTPMFSRGLRQFYIEELAQLASEEFVIPHDLVIREGELTARCSVVLPSLDGWKLSGEEKIVKSTEFKWNYYDIIARVGNAINWAEDGIDIPQMPNELREIANEEDLYVVMLPLWCDDVSGNRSKQYNKHINMYMANSNLPGRLLQQEFFVHFVSASPNATAPEQFATLKDQINETHRKPIRCYNAYTKRTCSVMLRVPALPADNPQQSEEASHMGGNANCKCRKCRAGGTHEHTESNEGYHSLHFGGVARNAVETRVCLTKQLHLACYGVEKPVSTLQTETGTKDKITQHWIEILLQKSRELKSEQPGRSIESIATELEAWLDAQPGDKMNPLLFIGGLDPTQDTPVEILHTILLGIIKYVWHLVNVSWSDADRALFAIRLQATDLDGLSVPPLRASYMIQYRNNLIGKHFKTLMQTLAFHVHDIVSPEQFSLIKAVGELGALLWVHEIEDMSQYLNDLEILIANVLDTFGDVDPAKIIIKIKLHILVHLGADIRRFGPAIRNSTEIFECYNAIFRLCSIYSNHQAPSRDIAFKFSAMDRLKHILSGGYWKKDGKDGEWTQAGRNVLQVLKKHTIVQRHLGWVSTAECAVGHIRLLGKVKNPAITWDKTLAFTLNPQIDSAQPTSSTMCRFGAEVTARSGDKCSKLSWVFFIANSQNCLGRIAEIIVPEGPAPLANKAFITIETFVLADERHPDFNLPYIRRPVTGIYYQLVKSTDILFIFSAQHDCRMAKCQPSGLQAQFQERQLTNRMESIMKHNDDEHFVINMFALHNAILLRKTLPRHLTEPVPLYVDRRTHHFELAAGLRISQTAKRARTQEKRKATLARKKEQQAQKQQREESGDDMSINGLDSDDDLDNNIAQAQRKRRRKD